MPIILQLLILGQFEGLNKTRYLLVLLILLIKVALVYWHKPIYLYHHFSSMHLDVYTCVSVHREACLRRLSSPFMFLQGLAMVLFLQMFPSSCLSLYFLCVLSELPFSEMRNSLLNFQCLVVCFLCNISQFKDNANIINKGK